MIISSSIAVKCYYDSVLLLNKKLLRKGLLHLEIVMGDDNMETENIPELVDSGAVRCGWSGNRSLCGNINKYHVSFRSAFGSENVLRLGKEGSK
ncbi:MAG: hypothetical protein ABID54_06395 [Pseudomonadota bacterium]